MHVIGAEEQTVASHSAFTRVPEDARRQEPPAPSPVD
jgi:hypothetical protein